MSVSLTQLDAYMHNIEDEHTEFKEAKNQLNTDTLIKYCTALSNEGGGMIILGVSDGKPRKVVGTNAFGNLNTIKTKLLDKLKMRVEVSELTHPDGRVLVFEVPSHPVGMPVPYEGAYYMRSGEGLVTMTPDALKRIFDADVLDFSAEICEGAKLDALSPKAIENLRAMWRRKSDNSALDNLSTKQLLTDAELMVDGKLTYAALVLLGTRQGLGKYLSNAEVIFEYRVDDAEIPSRQRKTYREGFFLFEDNLWNTIDAHNEIHHYQDGLFVGDIPTFNERVVREALLNAISHRDYRLQGSTFVKQYSQNLEVISPGGFAPGITPDNILYKQVPRNRRIAEVFEKCGLVERSGQGARLMFELSIKDSKLRPDYSRTDDHEVFLTLRGEVQNPRFLAFLEKVGKETLSSFNTQDFLILDLVNREQPIPKDLRERLPKLIELGVIEAQGGRGKKRYLFSRRFYGFLGAKGVYTRRRGLDKETEKALIEQHVKDNNEEGAVYEDISQVLPTLGRAAIQRLMSELRDEERIHVRGRTKGARWHAGPKPAELPQTNKPLSKNKQKTSN